MKAAFSAMGEFMSQSRPTPRRGCSRHHRLFKPKPQPDGTITHFYKPEENGAVRRRGGDRRHAEGVLLCERGSLPCVLLRATTPCIAKDPSATPRPRACEYERGTEANAVSRAASARATLRRGRRGRAQAIDVRVERAPTVHFVFSDSDSSFLGFVIDTFVPNLIRILLTRAHPWRRHPRARPFPPP